MRYYLGLEKNLVRMMLIALVPLLTASCTFASRGASLSGSKIVNSAKAGEGVCYMVEYDCVVMTVDMYKSLTDF